MSRNKKPAEELPPGCPRCRHGRLPFVMGDHGATRCDCPRGIALRQADRQRLAEMGL